MLAKQYTKKLLDWITPYITDAPETVTTERLCINITHNTLSLIKIDKANPFIQPLLLEELQYEGIENITPILAGLSSKYQLADIPLTWVLPQDEYQLFLIDSLPVKEDELLKALNWRLRNLLNYPVEEAAIDYFTLPIKKTGTVPIIVAVAARVNRINQYITVLKKAGLNLEVIDIPELALKNLSALYEDDEKSTAFIYFYNSNVILNISRKKSLFFTRKIILANTDINTPDYFEHLSLEILRYFDYYQSQWRFPNPTRIFIASEMSNDCGNMATKLTSYLGEHVEPFSLKPTLQLKNNDFLKNSHFLLPLGGILREE